MSAIVEGFRAALTSAWQRSDALFALVPRPAWRTQPIDLRHPILFYVGHLPAFAWNQIGRGALGLGHLSPHLDVLYARGIDPGSFDIAQAQKLDSWPTLEETLAYRDEVRAAILRSLPDVLARTDDVLCEQGRVLQLVLEHEWMHHETVKQDRAQRRDGLQQTGSFYAANRAVSSVTALLGGAAM